MEYSYKRLQSDDVAQMRELNTVFAKAFEDTESYATKLPSDGYLRKFLGKPETIALVAQKDARVIGGLVAYILEKFEQERKEIYIYDVAVAAEHRRHGIATQLIRELQAVARNEGAYVIYVQADREDDAAIALYESLGTKEEVLHFDIEP